MSPIIDFTNIPVMLVRGTNKVKFLNPDNSVTTIDSLSGETLKNVQNNSDVFRKWDEQAGIERKVFINEGVEIRKNHQTGKKSAYVVRSFNPYVTDPVPFIHKDINSRLVSIDGERYPRFSPQKTFSRLAIFLKSKS